LFFRDLNNPIVLTGKLLDFFHFLDVTTQLLVDTIVGIVFVVVTNAGDSKVLLGITNITIEGIFVDFTSGRTGKATTGNTGIDNMGVDESFAFASLAGHLFHRFLQTRLNYRLERF
jgi:hypothetical protein